MDFKLNYAESIIMDIEPSSQEEMDAWHIQDTLLGLAEAERGEFASDAEVAAFFQKYDCKE
jgi:predicted transcriptional regulator